MELLSTALVLWLWTGRHYGEACTIPTTCVADTEWNKNSIREHLEYFLRHVSSPGENCFHKFQVRFLKNPNGVAVLDSVATTGKSNRLIGWKAAGHFGSVFHDGFLFGPMDKDGNVTGEKVVFVYPDFRTALVGHFEKGVMISAKRTRIKAERCLNGIKMIKVAKPKAGAPELKFQRPTRIRPGDQPTVPDPYERRMIYIGDGVKEDGVFAKRKIRAGELISYYSGVIFDSEKDPIFFRNQTKYEQYMLHRNLMSLSHVSSWLQINVPFEYWNITSYRATLGHKFNHSFTRAKAYYSYVSHPRFGHIVSIVAASDISRGEEIFVQYNYPVGYPNAEQWYIDLYQAELGRPWPYSCQNKNN